MSKEIIEEKETFKLFCYTDGSCSPNPGPTGYGIHMILASNIGKPKTILSKYKFTEKGYMLSSDFKKAKNIKELSFKYVIDTYGYVEDSSTNNTAEMDAITELPRFIELIHETTDIEIDEVILIVDSTYVLNNVYKVLEDRFNINNVNANVEYVAKMVVAVETLMSKYKVKASKIKGHNDDLGNDRADMLANMGRLKRTNNTEQTYNIYIGKDDFWKDPQVDNVLFYFKQLFNFYPDNTLTSNIYYGLNYKDDLDLGKKMSAITYSILHLKEPNEIVNSIIKIIRDVLGDDYYPYVIKLSELINKNLLRDYLRFGEDYLTLMLRNNISVRTVKHIEVGKVLNPIGLAIVVSEKIKYLNDIVEEYKLGNLPANTTEVDITNLIYTKNKKDVTVIKPEMINDKYIIKHKIGKNTIRIKPKLDLPNRNVLKRLEKRDIKVKLLITDLGLIYEYNTMIIIDNSEYLYSSNVYANKVIKKL